MDKSPNRSACQMIKKKILITGSSRGIGFSIAKSLSEAGHDVVITGRDIKKLAEASEKIKASGFISGDLMEKDFVQRFYKSAVDILENVDVLINNAGSYTWSSIEKTPREEIEKTLKLNLQIPYELCRLVAPEMKAQGWGRIINIGSISGAVGEANASLYSASKAGLIGLTKSLALELAEFGITVNVINPGWVKTGLTEQAFNEDQLNEQEQLDMIPQKRWINPDEIAELVKYLISEPACGVTGQSLNLCCGLSLG